MRTQDGVSSSNAGPFTVAAPAAPRLRPYETLPPGTVAVRVQAFNRQFLNGLASVSPAISRPPSSGLQRLLRKITQRRGKNSRTSTPVSVPSTTVTPDPSPRHDDLTPATRSGFGHLQGGGWAPPAGRRISVKRSQDLKLKLHSVRDAAGNTAQDKGSDLAPSDIGSRHLVTPVNGSTLGRSLSSGSSQALDKASIKGSIAEIDLDDRRSIASNFDLVSEAPFSMSRPATAQPPVETQPGISVVTETHITTEYLQTWHGSVSSAAISPTNMRPVHDSPWRAATSAQSIRQTAQITEIRGPEYEWPGVGSLPREGSGGSSSGERTLSLNEDTLSGFDHLKRCDTRREESPQYCNGTLVMSPESCHPVLPSFDFQHHKAGLEQSSSRFSFDYGHSSHILYSYRSQSGARDGENVAIKTSQDFQPRLPAEPEASASEASLRVPLESNPRETPQRAPTSTPKSRTKNSGSFGFLALLPRILSWTEEQPASQAEPAGDSQQHAVLGDTRKHAELIQLDTFSQSDALARPSTATPRMQYDGPSSRTNHPRQVRLDPKARDAPTKSQTLDSTASKPATTTRHTSLAASALSASTTEPSSEDASPTTHTPLPPSHWNRKNNHGYRPSRAPPPHAGEAQNLTPRIETRPSASNANANVNTTTAVTAAATTTSGRHQQQLDLARRASAAAGRSGGEESKAETMTLTITVSVPDFADIAISVDVPAGQEEHGRARVPDTPQVRTARTSELFEAR